MRQVKYEVSCFDEYNLADDLVELIDLNLKEELDDYFGAFNQLTLDNHTLGPIVLNSLIPPSGEAGPVNVNSD